MQFTSTSLSRQLDSWNLEQVLDDLNEYEL